MITIEDKMCDLEENVRQRRDKAWEKMQKLGAGIQDVYNVSYRRSSRLRE